jgi:ribosomal protein S27AE
MAGLMCPQCGPVPRPVLEWRHYTTAAGEGHRHLGAYCPTCGRWLKWLRQQKPMLPARRGP